MASVSSLDKDLRKMRLDKYTPQAANEVRDWIDGVLGDRLPSGDLLDALKDGVALCKLVNLAVPYPGVKFKPSAMPFVQMENISIFLRACQAPPLNLQPHDVFLTVDLFEQKDPAQVLQCLGAFSRVANQLQPSRFPTAIGPKSRPGMVSPQGTGTPTVGGGSYGNRGRDTSSASNSGSGYNPNSKGVRAMTPNRTGDSNSGRWSPTKNGAAPTSPGGGVSSWSKKQDEAATAPAWNIAQYGYMGGASQGNMGISFGGRRQITSAGPHVPNLAEKEKKRREKEAEEERQRQEMEEMEHQRRLEREAEEERARVAEEARWAEETRKIREQERLKAEEEKRKWEEEERRWKLEEEKRQQEDKAEEAKLERERTQARGNSDARLRGQFLSQYQAEQSNLQGDSNRSGSSRIKELEQELELARERERQYERERQERLRSRGHQAVEDHDASVRVREESRQKSGARSRSRSRSRNRLPLAHKPSEDEEWRKDEREYLRAQWSEHHEEEQAPSKPPRPLPEPAAPVRVKTNNTGPSSRPLPDPTTYASKPVPPPMTPTRTYSPNPTPSAATPNRTYTPNPHPPANTPNRTYTPNPPPSATTPNRTFTPNPPPATSANRTDRYLSSNPAPHQQPVKPTYSSELGAFDSTAERDAEDRRREASQVKTKAGGWASKSLLEREMELERQRQQEWEEGQKATAKAVRSGDGVDGVGGGIGGKWDVNQWTGYTGGDGQNKGTQGIGAGRRQIVGPRPPPPGR